MARNSLVSLLVLACAAVLPSVIAQNTYPIVLVHGFSGWGRDELLGYKYWGGIQGDLQEQLKVQGYTVYTAAVGPFSSNWDRACELYAQIKGGQVDYGLTHSTKHGHARYGRNYTGLYPAWGTTTNGKVNKIHLIGHSMGGQTIRMLAHMLEKGTAGAPVVETGSSSPLFAGGKSWVHSITTISTPNQGTTLADGFSEIGDTVKGLLASVLNVVGLAGSSTSVIYDAKLDQWGITAKKNTETVTTYLTRIFSSSIFKPGFKDVCLWSLSTSGAKEESTWVTTLADVYYFSYSTIDTYSTIDWLLRKISLPNVLTMLLPLDPLAVFLGGRYAPDSLKLSTDWQPNDGVVNTISMAKDSVGSAVTFSGTSVKGKWNKMTQLNRMDHLAIIGTTLHTQVLSLYTATAQLLASLPADGSTTRQLEEEGAMESAASVQAAASASITTAIANLQTAAVSVQTTADLQSLCANPINSYAQNYCTNMLNAQGSSTRRHLRG